MSWAKTGWDAPDNEPYGNGGGNGDYTRRFWMPAEATKRVLFISGSPYCFWEHNLYGVLGDSRKTAICLDRNKIDDRGCPICNVDDYPYFVGMFTIINMGDIDASGKLSGYVTKDGNIIQFTREIYPAKRGSKDKPGTLKKLQRLAQKRGGDLMGTVWDIYRSGSKSPNVGDEFEFVERIAPKDWKDYLVNAGADGNALELDEFDYDSIFVPKSYDALQSLVGVRGHVSDEGKVEGAGYDDDLPF